RFADAQTGFDNTALNDRQFFVRDLNAQIAAGDHDAIRGADDFVEVGHGLLVFDFGDDERRSGMVLKELLELKQIARFANERKRNEIDADLETKENVLDILGRERRKADFHAGQID